MVLPIDQIRAAALRLEPAARELLADELLLSLADADRDALDRLWLAEITLREQALTSGSATAKPIDEVLTRIASKPKP